MDICLWRVVGGETLGGISVRQGADLESPQWPARLSTDALVWQLGQRAKRVQYLRLSGTGPDLGWVSVECRGKRLLVAIPREHVGPALFVKAGVEVQALRKVLAFDSGSHGRKHLVTIIQCMERSLGRSGLPQHPSTRLGDGRVWGTPASPMPGSDDWSQFERTLQSQSEGRYDPPMTAKLRRSFAVAAQPASGAGLKRPYRVSVVAPTLESRQKFHWYLWACFMKQTWPDKELIVVDTYKEAPSHFFLEKVIVNFDDDDLYAPGYIESMLEFLEGRDAVALTLSTWYDFDMQQLKCGFVDPIALGAPDPLGVSLGLARGGPPRLALEERLPPPEAHDTLFGYGFSYVHLRAPAIARPYPDVSLGEDVAFIAGLQEAHGERSMRLVRDEVGVCLHVMHGGNTADSAIHRDALPEEGMGLAVWDLDFALPLRDAWQASFVPSDVAGQFRH
uniref:Glycosyltransferase 2-like domain-containing protein n=1 Tax=Alexandrium monilatum TaxID=311494 RepID=A0A7S4RBM0_9DINO